MVVFIAWFWIFYGGGLVLGKMGGGREEGGCVIGGNEGFEFDYFVVLVKFS